jgi:hypothetical protein
VGSHLFAFTGVALMMALLSQPVEPALGAPQAQAPSSSASSQRPQPQQATPAQQDTDVDKLPISLDRIREQLSHEPAFSLNLLRALDIPVFRIEQRGDLVFRSDLEWKDNDVGDYVRPTVNQWHYDFTKMTNPNLPTGYGPGGGVDVLPAIQSVFSSFRHASQERERGRVRQQIREELRQINEERRRAGLPPLDEPPVTPTSTAPDQAPAPTPQPQPQPNIKVTPPPQP